MEPGAGDDGTLAGLPWASVFDPAANARALGEIQKRGLRAAGEVVDRLVRSVDGERSIADTGSIFGADPAGSATDVGRLAESWFVLLRQLMETFGGTSTSQSASAPSFELGLDEAAGELLLESESPGPVRSEIWLHNATTDEAGGVQLRCSDLLAHDGQMISAAAVRFDPVEVSSMPPRSSRGVAMVIDVPSDAAASIYRGTLLAHGHPDIWLPVTLELKSTAE